MGVYIAKPPSPIWQPGNAPAGCRLYLPFHESAGKVIRDLSGSHYDGTFAGSPTWARGLYGPQCVLNGTTDAIDFGGNTNLLPSKLSIVALVKWAGGTGPRRIASSREFTSTNGYILSLTDGVPKFIVGDGSVFMSVAGSVAINSGQFYCLSGSYDGKNLTCYQNGVSVGSTAFTGAINYTNSHLVLGADWSNSGSTYATFGDVTIAGAILMNRAASSAEIAAISADLLSGRFSAVRPRRRNLARMFDGCGV